MVSVTGPLIQLGMPSMREVDPDHVRDWVELPDPADVDHLIRADLTWLLSAWTCIYGRGCAGISGATAGGDSAELGCCSHGAFYSDSDDEDRVLEAAGRLTAADWQHRPAGGSAEISTEDDLEGEPARRTAIVDGACLFLNRSDWVNEHGGGAAGCALHALALREGRHPLSTKPDVCWQLPVRRSHERVTRPDDVEILVTSIGEYDRRGWGPGGVDLHWWCTGSPAAHVGLEPLYLSYAAELVALLGQPAYDALAVLCAARTGLPPHPATESALSGPHTRDTPITAFSGQFRPRTCSPAPARSPGASARPGPARSWSAAA